MGTHLSQRASTRVSTNNNGAEQGRQEMAASTPTSKLADTVATQLLHMDQRGDGSEPALFPGPQTHPGDDTGTRFDTPRMGEALSSSWSTLKESYRSRFRVCVSVWAVFVLSTPFARSLYGSVEELRSWARMIAVSMAIALAWVLGIRLLYTALELCTATCPAVPTMLWRLRMFLSFPNVEDAVAWGAWAATAYVMLGHTQVAEANHQNWAHVHIFFLLSALVYGVGVVVQHVNSTGKLMAKYGQIVPELDSLKQALTRLVLGAKKFSSSSPAEREALQQLQYHVGGSGPTGDANEDELGEQQDLTNQSVEQQQAFWMQLLALRGHLHLRFGGRMSDMTISSRQAAIRAGGMVYRHLCGEDDSAELAEQGRSVIAGSMRSVLRHLPVPGQAPSRGASRPSVDATAPSPTIPTSLILNLAMGDTGNGTWAGHTMTRKQRLVHIRVEEELIQALDPSRTGEVQPDALSSVFTSAFERCVFLAAGISQQNLRQATVDRVAATAGWAIFVLIYIALIGVDVWKVLLPFTTLLIALSFALGSTLSNIVLSFTFAASAPFDCGDQVLLDQTKRVYLVQDVKLLRTTFLTNYFHTVTVPNHELFAMQITNLHRSGHCKDDIVVDLDLRVSADEIQRLQAWIQAHVEGHADWLSVHTYITQFSRATKCVRIVARVEYIGSWADQMAFNEARGRLLCDIHEHLRKTDQTWSASWAEMGPVSDAELESTSY